MEVDTELNFKLDYYY